MKYYLKKAILFVLIAVLSLMIIGCGKKGTPDNSGKKCTIMVECSKIFDNQDKLDKAVKDYIPKDGIILKNADGELVISKTTLEELVNNIVKGFDSAQDATTKIIVDNNGGLVVNVILSVTKDAIIKELSTNLQTSIKSSIKKVSDLEVKEVNISIKKLQEQENVIGTMN